MNLTKSLVRKLSFDEAVVLVVSRFIFELKSNFLFLNVLFLKPTLNKEFND